MSRDATPVPFCFRDNISMRWEHASCLHPSSFCPYREFCLIFHKQRGAPPPSDDEDLFASRRPIGKPDSSARA